MYPGSPNTLTSSRGGQRVISHAALDLLKILMDVEKQVMSQYGLGPNGAITTSLNLFATRFDQVVGLLEKRSDDLE